MSSKTPIIPAMVRIEFMKCAHYPWIVKTLRKRAVFELGFLAPSGFTWRLCLKKYRSFLAKNKGNPKPQSNPGYYPAEVRGMNEAPKHTGRKLSSTPLSV